MRVTGLRTWVVGNPPPGFGGRYFVFLKLVTDNGIEGVGEAYAATFHPNVVVKMIEDVVERHVIGTDPFRIEALWRKVYGRGYSLRPDISLMGVMSAVEMALWDIVGKAVEKPVYELLGGLVHERLRTYTYIYPKGDETDGNLRRPGPVGAARGRVCGAGLHRGEVRPHGRILHVRPTPALAGAAGAGGDLLPQAARGRGRQGRPPVRHARPVHHLGRHPPRQTPGEVRAALVRGAGTARDARGDGGRGTCGSDPRGHRRAADHQVRVRQGAARLAPPRSCR